MTFEQAFKKIKTKFDNVEAAKLPDTALQITLSDEDCGGTFYAEVKDGILTVEPYDYKDNDAVIDVTRAAISAILDGKSSIDKEVEKGELSIKGDLEKAAAVSAAIVLPVKKPAAKKVVKTTEEKPAKKTEMKKSAKTSAKKTTPKKSTAKK